MAILAECPACHKKQSTRNKACSCGENMDKAKQSKRVRYWIGYRLPDRKQRRAYVGSFKDLNGYSIEDARKAYSKKAVQKAEKRLRDIKEDTRMTFNKLQEWYFGQERVKALSSFRQLKIRASNFNSEFGNTLISEIKPADLENYQIKRKKQGKSDAYIDDEIGTIRTMLQRAFENYMISGDALRPFATVKKLLKRNANARNRVLSPEEFERLLLKASEHLKGILAMGYYTGMRKGEILKLTWDKVDLKERLIRLEAKDTKTGRGRVIPICEELLAVLRGLPTRLQNRHLFLFEGEPIKDIKTAMKTACKESKIPWGRGTRGGFVFHDLRHSFSTYMRKAGVSASVRMAITGHETAEMDRRYDRVDNEDIRQAVDQMQVYLKSLKPDAKIPNVDQTVDQNTK